MLICVLSITPLTLGNPHHSLHLVITICIISLVGQDITELNLIHMIFTTFVIINDTMDLFYLLSLMILIRNTLTTSKQISTCVNL